jgi:hypothetical protein
MMRRRGSLTLWVSDEAIAAWRAAPRKTPGGQARYSETAIETALRVMTWGITPYTAEDLRVNPEEVLARTPQIISEFIVNPQRGGPAEPGNLSEGGFFPGVDVFLGSAHASIEGVVEDALNVFDHVLTEEPSEWADLVDGIIESQPWNGSHLDYLW